MRRRGCWVVPVGVGCILLAGCDRTPLDEPTYLIRDSVGIRIVESSAPQWGEEASWYVDPTPSFDVSGATDDALYRLASPRLLGDGRLVIYNGGRCEIRIYDATGALESAFGGCGEGPGEFSAFGGIWPWPGDSVLVVDQLPRRLSIMGLDGLSRTMLVPMGAELPLPFVEGVLGDGSLLLSSARDPAGRDSPGVARGERIVALGGVGGSALRMLGVFPGAEWEYTDLGGGRLGRGHLTFSSSTQLAASETRIFVGYPDRFQIEVYGSDGALAQVIRRAFSPVAVSQADIDWLRERRLAEVDDPATQRLVRQAYRDLRHAETMPSFGVPVWPSGVAEGGPALLPDEVGNLWVFEHYRPGAYANRWSVFSREGVWLGIVALPDRLRPTQIGDDFVLGRWVDDLGFTHVRRFELVKPSEAGRAF